MTYTCTVRQERYNKYNALLERENITEETEEICDLCIQNLDYEEAIDNIKRLREAKQISRDVCELTLKSLYLQKQFVIDQLTQIKIKNLNKIED